MSFLDDHMSPYISRFADDLLRKYIPLTSRGGFILLRQRHFSNKQESLCVYDLFTGHHTFFSDPPENGGPYSTERYHLLTFADGINCSFLLFVTNVDSKPDNNRHIIQVQTATSACGTWAPSAMTHESSDFLNHGMQVVVLRDGVIHWLGRSRGEIVTYNVCTMEKGTIQLPILVTNFEGRLYLGSYYSHDGRKLLRLLGIKGFKICVWQQLLDGDWASGDMTIDTEEKVRTLDPGISTAPLVFGVLMWSSEGSNTVLVRIYGWGKNRRPLLIVIDLETREMFVLQCSTSSSMLFEVDLPSQLRAMKLFP